MSNYEDDSDIITLEFDDDTSVDCEAMGIFDFEDKEYIALQPLDGTDDVYLFGFKQLDNEFELLEIESDDFDRVRAAFDAIMEDNSKE
ncbi:MAG: DUF1292 domain-containing protein [Firmicutes bacterium]|nr:DUF1292 domain-containing protein [Bacillota bacterium]